jgi:hypothetical protein
LSSCSRKSSDGVSSAEIEFPSMSKVISPFGCRVAKASFASPRVPRQNCKIYIKFRDAKYIKKMQWHEHVFGKARLFTTYSFANLHKYTCDLNMQVRLDMFLLLHLASTTK